MWKRKELYVVSVTVGKIWVGTKGGAAGRNAEQNAGLRGVILKSNSVQKAERGHWISLRGGPIPLRDTIL